MLNYEKVLGIVTRTPGWPVWLVSTVGMSITVNYFYQSVLWTSAFFLPLLAFVEALSRRPSICAQVVAYEGRLAIASALVLMSGAIALVSLASPDPWPLQHLRIGREAQASANLTFLILGALIGLLLRQAVSRLAFATLIGRRRLLLNMLVALVWTLGLVLFPQLAHSGCRFYYLLGIGLGILLHRSSITPLGYLTAAYRRLQDVADAFPPRAHATREELQALELLAAGRQFPSREFRHLRSFLHRHPEAVESSKRLQLIRASVDRLEGKYADVVNETSSLAPQPADSVTAHILLLRVIALRELRDVERADHALDAILATQHGRQCPIATALDAERTAESVLGDVEQVQESRGPLFKALDALEKRAKITRDRAAAEGAGSVDQFLMRFTEIGVPVTASFMLNILGYSMLAAGFPEESRVMLIRCIGMDPRFSSGYLHLGDALLYRSVFVKGSSQPKRSDLWHARACYEAARLVEKNEASRVHALAKTRLETIRSFRELARG